MKDTINTIKNPTIEYNSVQPPNCWICKDQGMVFYSKMIGGISYDFAYRCNCKLGQAYSDSVPTIPTVLTEKTAVENYRKFSKEFKD